MPSNRAHQTSRENRWFLNRLFWPFITIDVHSWSGRRFYTKFLRTISRSLSMRQCRHHGRFDEFVIVIRISVRSFGHNGRLELARMIFRTMWISACSMLLFTFYLIFLWIFFLGLSFCRLKNSSSNAPRANLHKSANTPRGWRRQSIGQKTLGNSLIVSLISDCCIWFAT